MEFVGTVVKGNEVGGKFGIATANLEVPTTIDLEEGVYLVETFIDQSNNQEQKTEGLLHYGQRKTFGSDISVEVHILNFEQNLYSKKIRVRVLRFLRAIQKFQNADSLFTQIEKDIIHAEKYFLRRRIQQMWRTVRESEGQEYSRKAIEKIAELDDFQAAKVILAYAPQSKREVDFVEKLWKKFPDKKWYFPRTRDEQMTFHLVEDWGDLEVGNFEILEPPVEASEFVMSDQNVFGLIPAVALDRQGNRLGRGGGYYDQFLAQAKDVVNIKTVGVVPEFALLEKVPTEPHDSPVDNVIAV